MEVNILKTNMSEVSWALKIKENKILDSSCATELTLWKSKIIVVLQSWNKRE